VFLAVAIWLKSTRTILADIPMPMRAGAVTKDFTVDYDGPIYSMQVRFDGKVSATEAICFLGGIKSDLHPDLNCGDTDSFASLLCLIGVVVFALSFLRSRLNRTKKLIGETSTGPS